MCIFINFYEKYELVILPTLIILIIFVNSVDQLKINVQIQVL